MINYILPALFNGNGVSSVYYEKETLKIDNLQTDLNLVYSDSILNCISALQSIPGIQISSRFTRDDIFNLYSQYFPDEEIVLTDMNLTYISNSITSELSYESLSLSTGVRNRDFYVIKGGSDRSYALLDDNSNTYSKRVLNAINLTQDKNLCTVGNLFDYLDLYDFGGVNNLATYIDDTDYPDIHYTQLVSSYDSGMNKMVLYNNVITDITSTFESEDLLPISVALVAMGVIYYQYKLDPVPVISNELNLYFNLDALVGANYVSKELVPNRFFGNYVNFSDINDQLVDYEKYNLYYNDYRLFTDINENDTINYDHNGLQSIIYESPSTYVIKYDEVDPVGNYYELIVCQIEKNTTITNNLLERRSIHFEFLVHDEPTIVYPTMDESLISGSFDETSSFLSVSKERVIYYSGYSNHGSTSGVVKKRPYVIKSCTLNRVSDSKFSYPHIISDLESSRFNQSKSI